jgi:hypothetical protein
MCRMVVKKLKFSKEVLDKVSDGDQHTKLLAIKYSTSVREVVTVGHMIENPQNN